MNLFEVSGSVSGFGVKLLVPVTAFVAGTVAHGFDNQQNGVGCTGDHYDNASTPPTPDAQGGAVTITGYSGGSLLLGGSSSQKITCTRTSANYTCAYDDGTDVASSPFNSGAHPLGSGPITFQGAGGADFGAFTLMASPDNTVSVSENLASIHYSATADTTLHYTCAGGTCNGSIVLISLLASQNSASNPGKASPTSGLISCVAQGGNSLTIPKGAIAAMFANDTKLQSVLTTVVRATASVPTTHDNRSQLAIGNVGLGVFGVASK
jgi:hypothetical protein